MRQEVYTTNEDGTVTLVETKEIEGPSVEDQIAEKEAKLLEMYAELEALKAQQNQ
jgi:hypothetical protein